MGLLYKMDNILVVSCIFGTAFHKTYEAPFSKNCIFFTNNTTLKDEIIRNGWMYVYVNMELVDDEIISSLQSKYVKFLFFLKDFPEYNHFSKILYTDHKFQLLHTHIEKLLQIHEENPEKRVIIRKTPGLKKSIYQEIDQARGQSRYLKHMDETIEFIEQKREEGEISTDVRISNTGILFYVHFKPILPMLNSIYNSCLEFQQPECQIFWAVYSQKYMKWIQQIEFSEVNPLWRVP